MLEVRDLALSLPDLTRKPAFGPPPLVDILKDINLDLGPGETLGLVGESGSGKTSLGRAIIRLYRPTSGTIAFEGRDITSLEEAALRPLRPRFQMIFQDPQSSLNPRQRIADILSQPLIAYGRVRSRKESWTEARRLLDLVGLDTQFAGRYPHELSGGQRQRIGIARAIALEPALVVADEIVSGLDVSSQAQILALLRRLRKELGLALIFISHDLSVVRTLCDRVMVMFGGEIIEQGECAELFAMPRRPYTRKLLDAIPLPDVDEDWLQSTQSDDVGESTKGEERIAMNIKGSVALVTGANRGIGQAYVKALLERGAAKVYAGMRDTKGYESAANVEAIQIDITNEADISAAAKNCSDVSLLINNGGVNHNTSLIAHSDIENARAEIETNYFGSLNMCRAFAPVLKANGGGAIINMLSILARVNLPLMGSLCASKAAALSMTQGVRAELAGQKTTVIAVMPGAVDTRMSENFPPPKANPKDVAAEVLDGIEAGVEEIYPGDMAKGVSQGLVADPKSVEKEMGGYLPG